MTTESNLKNKKIINILFAFIIILFELYFFEPIMFHAAMPGDSGDARLNMLIMEHWYKCFSLKESVPELTIFYPVTNTLSYTDMLLGFALPYSVLRFFQINMFLAYKAVLISTHIFGSMTLFMFVKKKFKLSSISSLLCVVLFSFSNAYFERVVHTQLFALSMVPLLMYFIYSAIENIRSSKRIKYMMLSVFYYCLLMYTSFYIAYFTFLFIIVLQLFLFIIYHFSGYRVLSILSKNIKENFIEYFIYLLLLVILTIPFFLMYIPTSKLYGPRNYLNEVAGFLPGLKEYISLSPSNYMNNYIFNGLKGEGELAVGFPIFIVTLFVCSILVIEIYRKRIKVIDNIREYHNTNVVFALGVSTFFCMLLILNIKGYSLWFFIYKCLPGASAIRAVVRLNLFLTLPLAIVCSMAVDHLENYFISKKNIGKIGGAVIVFLSFIVSVPSGGIGTAWNSQEMKNIIEEVPMAPAQCKVMAIIDTSENEKTPFQYQLDAWMIANDQDLFTINGYSGQFPIGWDLYDIKSDGYISNMKSWVNNYNINNFCIYDIGQKEWKEIYNVTK